MPLLKLQDNISAVTLLIKMNHLEYILTLLKHSTQ